MARLRDREARYQLSCRIMDSFQPSGFVSLSLISFDSPCLFSLRHLSPSFFLLHDIYLSSFLSTTSLFICLFLSLVSVVTPQKRARPCLIMKRFRVSCRCALGTGAGEWKRLRKSKRERMLHDYGRGKTRRERKYELSLGTHREYSLSTRRRMAADHEARTIKPFCRKTPVITPHQPLRRSTDRLLLRRFSFRARFFSSLVFHSRLFRCSRFPHSNSPRWFPLASSLPFTFSTILLLFFYFFLILSFEHWMYKWALYSNGLWHNCRTTLLIKRKQNLTQALIRGLFCVCKRNKDWELISCFKASRRRLWEWNREYPLWMGNRKWIEDYDLWKHEIMQGIIIYLHIMRSIIYLCDLFIYV